MSKTYFQDEALKDALPGRRQNDALMKQVLTVVEGVAHRIEQIEEAHKESRVETQDYRRNNDRTLEVHRRAIEKQADAINCIKDYFQAYETKHAPALNVLAEHAPVIATMVNREKFWSGAWQKAQDKVAQGIIVVVLGAVVTAIWQAIKTAIRS